MDAKQLIQAISNLSGKIEEVKKDIEQIKLELARNEKVNKLESRMAAMEVKVWVVFGVLTLVASAVVGYFFQHNG